MGLSGLWALTEDKAQTSHQLYSKEVEHQQWCTLGDAEGQCLQDIRQVTHHTCHHPKGHTEKTDAEGDDGYQTATERRWEQMTCG